MTTAARPLLARPSRPAAVRPGAAQPERPAAAPRPASAAPTAAAAAHPYVEGVVALLGRLGEALARETGILAERRPRELEQFTEERERLIGLYQSEIQRLRTNPTLLAGAPAGEVERLKLAMKEFHDLLNQHRRMIFAAKTMTERLITSISEEVARRDRPAAGYTRFAKLDAPGNAYRGRPVSLALNQVV